MKLKIEIEMIGSAFEDDNRNQEAARIITHVADIIERGNLGMVAGAFMPVRDINGNQVGKAEVTI